MSPYNLSDLVVPMPETSPDNPESLHTRRSTTELTAPPVSGLYTRRQQQLRHELRLDVDGMYPQNMASGTVYSGKTLLTHWIANLHPAGSNRWNGVVVKRYRGQEDIEFPYTNVVIEAKASTYAHQRSISVEFSAGGITDMTHEFKFTSPYYRPMEFEFDTLANRPAVTSYQTHSHPIRPANLPSETLTIEKVYQRAGFDVKMTGRNNVIPETWAGADALWTDRELHDAMQTYWSNYGNKPQWAMWLFFASRRMDEPGDETLGVMFDYLGRHQRQGAAIFNDVFRANPQDPNPEAAMQRQRFFSACHEIGHAFNLYHSWIKTYDEPWLYPLSNDTNERSFMNYPHRVPGQELAFYADFEHRFSDRELRFMRHAPEPFVQMGAHPFGSQHAFTDGNATPHFGWKFELRFNRAKPLFQFMEPVMAELKLTNISSQPQLLPERILADFDRLTLLVKRAGGETRTYMPYAKYCRVLKNKAVAPGEAIYEPLFVSASKKGWLIDEPGFYVLQAALDLPDGTRVVSNPLQLRMAPPSSFEEEFLAQDFYSDQVGRILTFDGSNVLTSGIDTLRELTEKLPDHQATTHGRIALAKSLAYHDKVLTIDGENSERGIKVISADVEEAKQHFETALLRVQHASAQTLGHIEYRQYIEDYSDLLVAEGRIDDAVQIQEDLFQTLSEREISQRVLQDVQEQQERFQQDMCPHNNVCEVKPE